MVDPHSIRWHRLLGALLDAVLSPVGISVETDITVTAKPPRADILLLRRDQPHIAAKTSRCWTGRFHRSRYGYAAYQQMGVLDGIADSAPAYVDLALRLANEPDYRAEVSARIRDACPTFFEDQQAVTEMADCFEVLLAAKAS